MVKVSVLMPVYNTNENFLEEAIESILNQTFQDFELIILDDGSEKDIIHTDPLEFYDEESRKMYLQMLERATSCLSL